MSGGLFQHQGTARGGFQPGKGKFVGYVGVPVNTCVFGFTDVNRRLDYRQFLFTGGQVGFGCEQVTIGSGVIKDLPFFQSCHHVLQLDGPVISSEAQLLIGCIHKAECVLLRGFWIQISVALTVYVVLVSASQAVLSK